MNAEAATNWLTGPRAKKLLRLYLAWPNRFEAEPEEEAREFFSWLKVQIWRPTYRFDCEICQ